jgi:hypothetical protein
VEMLALDRGIVIRAIFRAITNGRQACMLLAPAGVPSSAAFESLKRVGPGTPYNFNLYRSLRGGMHRTPNWGLKSVEQSKRSSAL